MELVEVLEKDPGPPPTYYVQLHNPWRPGWLPPSGPAWLMRDHILRACPGDPGAAEGLLHAPD